MSQEKIKNLLIAAKYLLIQGMSMEDVTTVTKLTKDQLEEANIIKRKP